MLSFSLADVPPGDSRTVDGEVYVDLDTARERAPEFDVPFEAEVQRYVVHGLLHLMGYDDRTPAQKTVMRRLEDRYLATAGKPS